jgi:hypothetical protein
VGPSMMYRLIATIAGWWIRDGARLCGAVVAVAVCSGCERIESRPATSPKPIRVAIADPFQATAFEPSTLWEVELETAPGPNVVVEGGCRAVRWMAQLDLGVLALTTIAPESSRTDSLHHELAAPLRLDEGEFFQLYRWRADSLMVTGREGRAVVFAPHNGLGRALTIPGLSHLDPLAVEPGRVVGADSSGHVAILQPERLPTRGAAGLRWTRSTLALADLSSLRVDTVAEIEASEIFWSHLGDLWPLFGARPHVAFHAGRWIWAVGGASAINIFRADLASRSVSSLTWNTAPRAVSGERVDSWFEWTDGEPESRERYGRHAVRPVSVLPAFSDVLVDPDGRIWLERYRWTEPRRLGPTPSLWAVLNPDGLAVATLVLHANEILIGLGRSCLVSLESKAEGFVLRAETVRPAGDSVLIEGAEGGR